MSNPYYNHGGTPATGSTGSSSAMRSEFASVASGFDKLPVLSGFANKAVVVNAGGTALTTTTGSLALAGDFSTSGVSAIILTSTGATNVTLPTTGTLSTLTGTESLSNKTIVSPVLSGSVTGTYTLAGTPTITAPILSGTVTGTYTLAGTVTITSPTITSPSGIVAADIGNITAFARTFLDDANAAAVIATLGVKADSMSTGRLLGRTTASTGAIEEISAGNALTLSGGTLAVDAASESADGAIEIATEAEIEAGSSNLLAVTPGRLKGAIGFSAFYESSPQTITSAGALTLPHGLGRSPVLVTLELKCIDAGGDAGYAQNALVHVGLITNDGDGSAGASGLSVRVDTTNLTVRFSSATTVFVRIPNGTTGVSSSLTNTKWNAIFRAWA